MNSSTSTATIEKLRISFGTHGIPEMIVSDNGTCFTNEEFDEFMSRNGMQHVKSAPYHPASNGLAERAVQIVKDGLRKQSEGTVEQKLARFLTDIQNHTSDHTTGVAPCELLMGRRIRTKLDCVKPDLGQKVAHKQSTQKVYNDAHAHERSFQTGENVDVKIFAKGPKWLLAVSTNKLARSPTECCWREVKS